MVWTYKADMSDRRVANVCAAFVHQTPYTSWTTEPTTTSLQYRPTYLLIISIY